jgi:hypothetical protein
MILGQNFGRVGMGTLGHPGIFMGQAKMLGIKNHIDIPYVTAMTPEEPLDFGVLDLYALKQRTDSPLLVISVENAQTIYSDAEYYTFDLPTAADASIRLISGGLDSETFGRDGEEIPFIINKKELSPGAVFKFDRTSRISFTVVDRVPEPMGENLKIWARLNTNAYVKYVTKGEFIPNRQIFKLADLGGLDFRANESVWNVGAVPSLAKYKNYLSNATLQQGYRVTSGGAHYLRNSTRIGAKELKYYEQMALQFYRVSGVADSKFINMAELKSVGGAQKYNEVMHRLSDEMSKGNGEVAMVNLLDNIAIQNLLQQQNELFMWSDSIDILVDGYDSTRLVPGIWFQLDMAGYKHIYSIELFTLNTIANAIKDYEFGKRELALAINDRIYIVKTGMGGLELLFNAMLKDGLNVPGQVMNSDHKFLEGDANNLTVNQARIVKYQLKGTGYIVPQLEPGFDPMTGQDEIINPILEGGWRLSSYTMLIEDYNTSSDNIVIVRKKNEAGKIRMHVEAGLDTHPYLRSSTSIAGQNIVVTNGSDSKTGYKVTFTGRADTAIVKDPTKLLKLTPINPRTGRANL